MDADFQLVMISYVSNEVNLKLIMQMLMDSHEKIKLEAFHVFKIFIMNPEKPQVITRILFKNKVKIIAWLDDFSLGGEDIAEEKHILIDVM